MPAATITKEEILDRLMKAFRTFGYEGATLARLSEITGLQRASLYYYFPGGKEEMGKAILSHAALALERQVLAPLKSSKKSPQERLEGMSRGVLAFYDGGASACLLSELSAGVAGPLFADPIKRAMNSWISLIASVLVSAGIKRAIARQRAEQALASIQGALIVGRTLGSKNVLRQVLSVMPHILLEGAD
jgi:TetR/AcrR family transcriptional regulator, lmrAB and yxaGH operons repressor